jgi:hypothetical protein
VTAFDYMSPKQSSLPAGEWLAAEKARLDTLGHESGQTLVFHFDRDPRNDRVENLGRFERPVR